MFWAEGEDFHGDCTVALAAVDGGVRCKYISYRFWGIRLEGHIERCLGGIKKIIAAIKKCTGTERGRSE